MKTIIHFGTALAASAGLGFATVQVAHRTENRGRPGTLAVEEIRARLADPKAHLPVRARGPARDREPRGLVPSRRPADAGQGRSRSPALVRRAAVARKRDLLRELPRPSIEMKGTMVDVAGERPFRMVIHPRGDDLYENEMYDTIPPAGEFKVMTITSKRKK